MDHLTWIMEIQKRNEALPQETFLGKDTTAAETAAEEKIRGLARADREQTARQLLQQLEQVQAATAAVFRLREAQTLPAPVLSAQTQPVIDRSYTQEAYGAGPTMADISRFFERDARRFG